MLACLMAILPQAHVFAVDVASVDSATGAMERAAKIPNLLPVSVKPSVGFYQDNSGQRRTRSALEMSVGAVGLTLGQEVIRDDNWEQDKYLSAIYAGGERRNLSAGLTVTGNPGGATGKLTDLRATLAGADDGVVASRTVGVGLSRWTTHETLQLGVNVSGTNVSQPEYEILDFDATTLTAPETVNSRSVTGTARHLTSPTTMTLGSVSITERTDRPVTRFYHVGVRQYVPSARGAVHASVYRGFNHGTLSTKTLYGEVDSWTGELAWIQELGDSNQIRLGWRVHQELETGRAYQDQTQFGSDLYSIALASDIDPALTFGRPLTIDVGFAHYETNQELVANTANLGFTGRF